MAKIFFISYDFGDASFKGEVKRWIESAGGRTISVDTTDLRPLGQNNVEAAIRRDIGQADALIVLIGQNGHNRPWLDYEVSVANNYGRPIHKIRLPNRTGAAPLEVRKGDELPYGADHVMRLVR